MREVEILREELQQLRIQLQQQPQNPPAQESIRSYIGRKPKPFRGTKAEKDSFRIKHWLDRMNPIGGLLESPRITTKSISCVDSLWTMLELYTTRESRNAVHSTRIRTSKIGLQLITRRLIRSILTAIAFSTVINEMVNPSTIISNGSEKPVAPSILHFRRPISSISLFVIYSRSIAFKFAEIKIFRTTRTLHLMLF